MHEMKAEREALETKGREIIEKRDELKAEEQKGKSCDGYSTLVEYKKYKFSIHFRKRSLAALPGLTIQTGKGRKQVQIRQVIIITFYWKNNDPNIHEEPWAAFSLIVWFILWFILKDWDWADDAEVWRGD